MIFVVRTEQNRHRCHGWLGKTLASSPGSQATANEGYRGALIQRAQLAHCIEQQNLRVPLTERIRFARPSIGEPSAAQEALDLLNALKMTMRQDQSQRRK